jgi:hypothetical protein
MGMGGWKRRIVEKVDGDRQGVVLHQFQQLALSARVGDVGTDDQQRSFCVE